MARCPLFAQLSRWFRIARWCDEHGASAQEGVEQARAFERRTLSSRREFLAGFAATGAMASLPRFARAAPQAPLDVGIVGAGLAGLACADRLRARGIAATVYEASNHVGGRCFSLGGFFPGQVAERGGELIDNLHKTMLGFANRFQLAREDYNKQPGEIVYFFNGTRYDEAAIVDEFRAFVAFMHADLRILSKAPTADANTSIDVAFDRMSIEEYLDTRGAGSLIKAALGEAYVAEYGRELAEQSSLNLLLFIKVDKRSRFMPFGHSDERYHLVGGNDAVAQHLAAGLPQPVQHGLLLVGVSKLADGRIELTFKQGASTIGRAHDFVVLTIPFSVLRGIHLDASLGIPPWQRQALALLGYGTNAKQMVGFNGPFWNQLGSNGSSYSDLTDHQTTWQTNPVRATATRAILTDYASGVRGAIMNPFNVQSEAAKFIAALDQVFRGAAAAATNVGGSYLAHLEHWPSNPLALGSYTCYLPGQFTTIAGNEGKPVENLFFAGEHTNSFYVWQGFMEGAALSGIDAANAILRL
jgi:monoamine oxidase